MKKVCPKLDEKVKRTPNNNSELFATKKDLESFIANRLLLVIKFPVFAFYSELFFF